MAPPVLRAIIEEFRYPGGAAPALAGIDLSIAAGEFVLILGPAGAGKTTLCYSLAGVIPKSVRGDFRGIVEVAGRDIAGLSLPALSPLLSLVLQEPENQLFNITVAEDVAFGPENLNVPASEVSVRVRRSLEFTGTTHLAERFSHLLSGGESQRVVLASILAIDAGILILDQPAAGLDPRARRLIYENLGSLSRNAGKTIVMVEDRTSDVVEHATRAIVLDRGRIVRDARPQDLFRAGDLDRYGIRVPDVFAIRDHLSRVGLPIRDGALTVEDIIAQIRPLLPAPASAPVAAGTDDAASVARGAGLAEPVIDVRGLVHRYAAGVDALNEVDLRVGAGEFVAIVGENGAGKTTLAKHLVGLLRPARGRIEIQGRDIARVPAHETSRTVGFLFQDPDYQIFNNSCLEEVAYGLRLRGMPVDEAQRLARRTLERLGLGGHAEAHPYTLSRGERQRLTVACVLALRPPILVVDEPTTGLDYAESLAMMTLLEEYRTAGGTVLIITHDMDLAARFAQRIVVMAGGRITHDLPAAQIAAYGEALADSALTMPAVARVAHALRLPAARTPAELAQAVVAMRAETEGR
jgi:energy-coupling factor transport system ATP-binding protein